MLKIKGIPAFKDNYIWLIYHPQTGMAAVIDPGDADPVFHALKKLNLTLTAILLTHHHHDHAGGASQLQEAFSVPLYASSKTPLKKISHFVEDKDKIVLPKLDLMLRVLDIPGHTHDHIAFYGNQWLFCGDTLFTGGCGRLFEGTTQQMFDALEKLKKLPDETAIYCGHEYTEANLRFAMTVEPHNQQLKSRLAKAQQLRSEHQSTVPSTLLLEKKTNPFLRCHEPTIHQQVEAYYQTKLTTPMQVFSKLRHWKDHF